MNVQLNPAQPDESETPTPAGLLRALATLLGIGLAIMLYAVAFARLTAPLHLESDAGFILGVGALFVLASSVVGVTFLRRGPKGAAALALWGLVGGLVMVAVGWRRQLLISRARATCEHALANAPDAHQRISVLYSHGVDGLPDLSRSPTNKLSCLQLLR